MKIALESCGHVIRVGGLPFHFQTKTSAEVALVLIADVLKKAREGHGVMTIVRETTHRPWGRSTE